VRILKAERFKKCGKLCAFSQIRYSYFSTQSAQRKKEIKVSREGAKNAKGLAFLKHGGTKEKEFHREGSVIIRNRFKTYCIFSGVRLLRPNASGVPSSQ
jgi:hypothetical protein